MKVADAIEQNFFTLLTALRSEFLSNKFFHYPYRASFSILILTFCMINAFLILIFHITHYIIPLVDKCACENVVTLKQKPQRTSRLRKLSLCSYRAFADRNFEIGISVRWSFVQNDGKFSLKLWERKYDVVLKRSQRITNECYMGSSSLVARPTRVLLFCVATVTILQLPRCFQLSEKKDWTTSRRAYRFLFEFRGINPEARKRSA